MTKDQFPFERKSRCNHKSNAFLDESFNYVYTYEEQQDNGTYVTKTCVIPYTEENREVFILLDEQDHEIALSSRYYEESKDTIVEYRKASKTNTGDENDEGIDFLDTIADSTPLFGDEEKTVDDPRITEIQEWIQTLPESQINLIYKHLGEGISLEDIRREEELETGRVITKQAMHNRWKKIINKACKHFGVEPPKQPHK